MSSSSSKREGRGSSSSSSASSSREIPGFHFDQKTGRYYSLANAPPEYLKQLAEERAKEENELAMKRFKTSKMFANIKQKSKIKKNTTVFSTNSSSSCPLSFPLHLPTNFLSALHRREVGLLPHGYKNHHSQHFMVPLSDLFSARLRLNDHQQQNVLLPIELMLNEYTEYGQWKSSFSINQIRCIQPNSFILGPYYDRLLTTNNSFFFTVSPGKQQHRWETSISRREDSQELYRLKVGQTRVFCPDDMEHPVMLTVPDLVCPEIVFDESLLGELQPSDVISVTDNNIHEPLANVFCKVHMLGTTTSTETNDRSRQSINYSLDMIHLNRNLSMDAIWDSLSMHIPSELLALPVEGWPWSERTGLNYHSPLSRSILLEPNYHESKKSFYKHLCQLSYSLSWNSKYSSSSADLRRRTKPRLQCIDLQHDQKNVTDVLMQDSFPSAVLSGFSNGTLQLAKFNLSKEDVYPREVKTWRAASTCIRSVHFHPFRGPHEVIVAADESFLALFDTRFLTSQCSVIETVKPVITFAEHRSTTGVHNVTFDTDSDLIVCAGVDGMVRFWSASTGKLINLFEPFPDADAEERASVQCAYSSLFALKNETQTGEVLLAISNRTIKMYMGGFEDGVFQ